MRLMNSPVDTKTSARRQTLFKLQEKPQQGAKRAAKKGKMMENVLKHWVTQAGLSTRMPYAHSNNFSDSFCRLS